MSKAKRDQHVRPKWLLILSNVFLSKCHTVIFTSYIECKQVNLHFLKNGGNQDIIVD